MRIAVIGAGPRGLSMVERLLHNRGTEKFKIYLFDSIGPGGTIWRTNQSKELLMNTVAEQVTLFTDETMSSNGKVFSGPNLFLWSKTFAPEFIKATVPTEAIDFFLEEAEKLDANGQSTRIFHGLYQKWFYEQLVQEFSE
ncbi:MAG: FAD/NAD(P)-binding protein [Enterococcus sp.]